MATSPPTLTLSADQSEVKAGGTILLTAVLAHSGAESGEFALSIRGVDAAWVTFYPPTLSVAAGGQATATILVAPPANAAAADLTLTVRAVGSGPHAEAEATFSVRLVSTTSGSGKKARATRRLTWPRLLVAAGVIGVVAAVGVFFLLHRHGSPPPPRTADCANQSSHVVDLYSDDTTTAIRITDPDLADVRILRTEPSDTLSPLFSSLLALSPDGTHLAYVTAGNEALDDAHLWSIDVANPAQRQELATIPHGLWQVRPAWSPDNKQVVFLRLNEQQAAASQSQLELWVAEVGGQPHKVAAPAELRPDGFYGAGAQSLCWAQDNQSVIFPSVTANTSPNDQGSRAAGATQPAGGALDAGVPHQVAVNVQTGTTEDLAFPLTATDTAPTVAAAPAGGANCGLPVFSQNDPAWRNIIMQSSGDTIGKFGCAVTATAMLLNYYGSAVTPAQLNSCLGDKADLIVWSSVVPCANGGVSASNALDFAWPSLDQVLASGNPAIVGMVRGQTGLHFVVVTAGGGGDAPNYSVIDPWDGTTSKTLQTFLDAGYNLRWIRTYTGTDKACPRLVAPQTPAADASGVAPLPDGPLLVPAQLLPLFAKVADQTGVPREILLALARIESGFTPRASGPLIERFSGTEDAHALGMMQFLPSTYRSYSAQVDAARAKSATTADTYHALSIEAQAPAVTPLGDAGIWDPEASIWAAAFFLQQHGVATDQRAALFAYNNSDTYVDTVLKAAQQYKTGTVPDANMYDPNGVSKPGTLAAPNPLNPPPLAAAAAAAAAPQGNKQANAAAGQTSGGSGQANGGASGGSQSSGGASGTTGGANGSANGNTNGGASGTAGASSGNTASGASGGQVPIRWGFPEGSITRDAVTLNFNTTDNIGEVVKLSLLTLTVPGSTASPVNQSTPSRPFTPGMVIADDGVYEAVAITRQGTQTRVSRRKFTIDRTAPILDVSVVGAGGTPAATNGTGATQAVTAANTQRTVADGAIRLKISYADTLSGVASVEYRIDTGDWQLYFNAVAFKGDALIDIPGDHTITVRATDVAGNVSPERTLDFTVMQTANSPPLLGGLPILKPVSSTIITPPTTIVSQTDGGATATALAAPTATTTSPSVGTATVVVTATTGPAATATQTVAQPTGIATTLSPTVGATVTPTARALIPIALTSSAPTATTAVTPTVNQTPTVTTTPTVALTVSPTVATGTPNTTATASQQSIALTTTASVTTTTTTTTVTATTTPSPQVKIVPPSCSDAAVRSVSSCTAVTVTNTGTTDLHINNINTTGEFLLGDAGSTCTTAIAPNASCDIPILFIPTTVGKRLGSLTITDSAPDSPHSITLTGNGVGSPQVAVAPPLLTCPDTLLGRSSLCSLTLTNTGSAGLTIASGLVMTGDFAPDPQNINCGPTLDVTAHCTISVVFTPTVHGIRTGLLTITDTAPGSPQNIPMVGKGLAPGFTLTSAALVITPPSVTCPNTVVGITTSCLPLDQPLTLTNTGDGELTISSIVPHDDFLKIIISNKCLILEPNESCTLPITFAPTARGLHVSGITFNDNVIGSPQTVQVTGTGLAPVVLLNASSLTCPPTIVGGSPGVCGSGSLDSFVPLTLKNDGDAPLNVSSIIPNDPFITVTVDAPTAANPTNNANCGLILPTLNGPILPQQICTLTIKFTPTERGTHDSGLTITDDAVGSPHSVQLTAQGLAPVATLSPQAPVCPDTIVGQSGTCLVPGTSPAPLTLTNTGDAPLNVSSIVPDDPFIHVTVAPGCALLAPNAVCTLPISFVPTARGSHVSGLTITDNAPGSPHTVQLTVKGLAPVVTLSGTSLGCADTIVGQSNACLVPGTSPAPLTLTNAGDAPLNIASIVAGDDFKMPPGQCPATLGATLSCTLNVTFAPTTRGNHVSSLVISDNAPGSPHTVQLAAKGLAPVFSLSATAMTCPDTIVGQPPSVCLSPPPASQPLSLTNAGDAPLIIASIVTRDDFKITPQDCPQTLAAGATCTFQVTFAPTIRGNHVGNVVIADNAPGSPHSVQLTAKGLAPIATLSPQPPVCPDTIVGQSNPCLVLGEPPTPLTLTNTGDAPLTIVSVVPQDDFIKVNLSGCATTLAPNAVCTLPITFVPTARGSHTSGLTITDNAPGSPHSVQLVAKGLAPVVGLSVPVVTCPDTAVGLSTILCTPSIVTLTNSGDATLNIASIVPSKDFTVGAAPTGTACGTTLAPNTTSCTMQVTFAPTVAGTHEGNLAITDDAPGSPHVVQLLAKGLAPIVTLSASSVTCPDTIVGQSTSACTPGAVTLTNSGDAPLKIDSIVPSNDFTVAVTGAGCGALIQPGVPCQIAVTFAPTVGGTHEGNLVIADNALGSPHTVQLTAKGLAPVVTLNAPALACADTIVGQTGTCGVPPLTTPQPLTLTNSGNAPLNIASIVAGDDFKVDPTQCPQTVAAGANCTLQVTFAPTARGNHGGNLVIADNALGSPHTVQVTAKGIAPVVSLSAPSLTCPNTIVGQTPSACLSSPPASQPLILTNAGDSPLNIASIVVNDDFKIAPAQCPATLAALATCTVQVTFAPTIRGNHVGNLVIADDAPGSPQTVQLAAKGVAPVVTLSAQAPVCPDTIVGQSSPCLVPGSPPAPLTLTNTGDAPLTIVSVVPQDDFIKIDLTGCQTPLVPNAVCTLPITFAPTARGSHTSGLTITDNAPGSPHSVQLVAKGLAPIATLNATALTCADTIVGQSTICTPQPLTLTNTGDAPLTISSIAQGAGFSVTPTGAGCGATIAPNGVCALQVSFVPTARGTSTDSLTITDNAPGSPHTVQLTGKALAPVVTLSASSLTCLDSTPGTVGVNVGASKPCYAALPTTSLTLTNSGDAPLSIASIVASDDFTVDPTPCPQSLPATSGSNSCTLPITFAPKTAGSHVGAITITDNAPGSPQTVQLTGTGLAAVAALSRQSVDCGGTPLGTPVVCPQFTLTNSGTSPLTITNVVLDGDFTADASGCGTSLNPAAVCVILPKFGPTAAGNRVGSLTITDNAPGSPQTVALTGVGQAPILTLSAPTVACPDTVVGQTGTCTTALTLTNTGNASLTISSIAPTDDFRAAAGQCSATIAPTGTCPITITFVPGTAGSHVGVLTITDSAAGSPHSVQLTGTGLGPTVSLSTQSVACTGTLVGTTIACPAVTLTNTGTAPLVVSSVVLSGDFVATIPPACGSTIQVNIPCQIALTFGPTVAGSRVGSMTITDNAPGSPHAIALSGTGQAPVLALNPAAVTCPTTVVGQTGTCTTTLTLTNTGDATLAISGIAATDDFKVSSAPTGGCGTTLAPNSTSCALQVTFAPTVAGNHTGSVTITDNAAGSPHAVQLSGTASAPVVSFDLQSVSCPDTAINGSNPCAIITLKNTGDAPLTIASITAGSPFSVAGTPCPTSLGTGASCPITVTFAPTTFGNQTGFLSVADNAVGSPHKVPLSGNGIGVPAFSMTQAGACADTTVGSTTQCTLLVTVANASSATGNLVMSLITISSEFGIDSGRSTCGTILTPGSNCVLAISFTPASDGQRGGSLTITDNAAGSPQSATLTGKGLGTPAITILPTTLACPGTLVGTTASCPPGVTITNPGTSQLNLTQIAITGEFALDTLTNSTCGTAVAPGASCTLAINFTPTATGARPAGALTITDNAPASPQSVVLTGTGTQPALTLAPSAISCPDTLVNTTAVCSLTLTNSGTAPLTLNPSITAGGSDYQVHTAGACGTTVAPTASCTLSVDFKPTATGARPGTLTLADNAPGNPHTVALSGNGTQPAVTLSTASITCADTQTGGTGACQQVTITNSGSGLLTFSSPPATAAPFGVDATRTTCGTTLAAGASCAVGVNFTPGATSGPRSGTLTITDTAPTSPQSVSLAGNGVAAAPVLTVTPASATCPSTSVHATNPCTVVTVKNTSGTTALTITLPITTAGDFSDATTCGSSLAAGATCTVTVTFAPTATGVRDGTATINYNAGSAQTAVIPYSGTGT